MEREGCKMKYEAGENLIGKVRKGKDARGKVFWKGRMQGGWMKGKEGEGLEGKEARMITGR